MVMYDINGDGAVTIADAHAVAAQFDNPRAVPVRKSD